jgi:hypothetical protein
MPIKVVQIVPDRHIPRPNRMVGAYQTRGWMGRLLAVPRGISALHSIHHDNWYLSPTLYVRFAP